VEILDGVRDRWQFQFGSRLALDQVSTTGSWKDVSLCFTRLIAVSSRHDTMVLPRSLHAACVRKYRFQ
jgi:hypothetical protein